ARTVGRCPRCSRRARAGGAARRRARSSAPAPGRRAAERLRPRRGGGGGPRRGSWGSNVLFLPLERSRKWWSWGSPSGGDGVEKDVPTQADKVAPKVDSVVEPDAAARGAG